MATKVDVLRSVQDANYAATLTREDWYELSRNPLFRDLAAEVPELTAPLFERFSLGNTYTLRGWNKFDVAPLGGALADHVDPRLTPQLRELFLKLPPRTRPVVIAAIGHVGSGDDLVAIADKLGSDLEAAGLDPGSPEVRAVQELVEANVGADVFVTEAQVVEGEKRPYRATILGVPTSSGEEQEENSPPPSGQLLPKRGSVVLLRVAVDTLGDKAVAFTEASPCTKPGN